MLRRGHSLLAVIWSWLVYTGNQKMLKCLWWIRFNPNRISILLGLNHHWSCVVCCWTSSYPRQLRLRNRAVRWRTALVHGGADVLVAWAVVVQQHSPSIHRLLLFLQLWCHVLWAHLVVDAILAQVAVNSCVGERAKINDRIGDREKRNSSRREGKKEERMLWKRWVLLEMIQVHKYILWK